YVLLRLNTAGRLPNITISVPSKRSAISTNRPMPQRMLRSVMVQPQLFPLPRQFLQAVARLALDELADARVRALGQLFRLAVEQNLVLARLQAAQGIKHHHAVGHLVDGLHL